MIERRRIPKSCEIMKMLISKLTKLLTLVSIVDSTGIKKSRVLSLGGNGMIGSAVLADMIELDKYDIVQVSRSNWPWDSSERIQPFVKSVKCDRRYEPDCAAEKNTTGCNINGIHQCLELMEILANTDIFDLVLDFSAFEAKWVHDAIQALKGKVGLYIYISTDSVYEVSIPKPRQRPSKETDAVRPSDKEEVKKLKKLDPYGHDKFAGELALVDQQENKDGFPWVSLRLADVIGPRDTSERWWVYQMWVKFYKAIGRPIFMPERVANTISSVTYVEDVPAVVRTVIEKGPTVWNQAYNIAMEEEFSLSNILLRIRDGMGGNQEVVGDLRESEDSFYNYPSVMSGSVDISKAKDMLDFKPTSADEAFEKTIEFYEDAFVTFPNLRDEVLADMLKNIVPLQNKDDVYKEIDKVLATEGYSSNMFRQKRKGEMEELPASKKKEEF